MLENELVVLVNDIADKKCETNYIEVKAARTDCPKLFDTLSSFSNQSGGGKIVFGIDESSGFEICGVYNAADLQKKIMEQCAQMEPAVRALCTAARIGRKTVVCAEIGEIDNMQKPCFYKGAGRLKGSYVRVGDGDVHMTEYEVYSYEAFKQKTHDEIRIPERAEADDIKTAAFSAYLLQIKLKKPKLSQLSNEKICKLQGLCVQDKPTMAGILLFSEYPQAFFPQLCVTAVSIPGTQMSMIGSVGERFVDNQRIDGTLPQLLEDALLFVRKNMKTRTVIDSRTGKRTDIDEYPVTALREIIINALIHRDYSFHTENTPITIKMFSDRIEVENPGGLYGRMTLDMLGTVSADTRNPFIASAMEVLGETENRYSGIPTIRAEMERAALPEPLFENERGVFRVTLYNHKKVPGQLFGVDEQRLIEFCRTPRSRSEIAGLFEGELTIAYVMSKLVHPLIEKGIIFLTMPDRPKSKNQRYVTKERGAI